MRVFVVVDVGCIECGESTRLLGIYATREEAEAAHKVGDYFSDGQHCVDVFEAESPSPPPEEKTP